MFLRQVFANETAATPSRSTYYLYHGWNCYAECESLSATPTLASAALARSHVWGLDLSSTMEGAGGVGGLVWTKNQGTGANHLVCQDGNGNVRKLINSSTFAISASYDYGPFGELLRASGPEAKANRYRFSTKPQDPVTGLLYYTNRWYDSTNGRWPSRDPIEENGGMNLYGFVRNNGVNRSDVLGKSAMAENNSCCTSKLIDESEGYLRARYQAMMKALTAHGKMPHGKGSKKSCKNRAAGVMYILNPVPKCWDCKEKRGFSSNSWFASDHVWVECTSTPIDGTKPKVIAFDAWSGNSEGVEGAAKPDTADYPVPGKVEDPTPISDSDCDREFSYNYDESGMLENQL